MTHDAVVRSCSGGAAGDPARSAAAPIDPARRGVIGMLAALASLPLAGCAGAPPATVRADPGPLFASAQPPRVGDRWRYVWSSGWRNIADRGYSAEVLAVSGSSVRDRVRVDSVEGAEDVRDFDGRFAVTERSFPGLVVREVSPYLQAFGPGLIGAGPRRVELPRPDWGMPWHATVRTAGPEPVRVGAGTFDAMRVDISATRPPVSLDAFQDPVRFIESVWYAPAARRIVLQTRQSFARNTWPLDRERYELVEYRPAA